MGHCWIFHSFEYISTVVYYYVVKSAHQINTRICGQYATHIHIHNIICNVNRCNIVHCWWDPIQQIWLTILPLMSIWQISKCLLRCSTIEVRSMRHFHQTRDSRFAAETDWQPANIMGFALHNEEQQKNMDFFLPIFYAHDLYLHMHNSRKIYIHNGDI